MRILPILSALLVAVIFYFAIFDRATTLAFMERQGWYSPAAETVAENDAAADGEDVTIQSTDNLIKVVVRRSEAQSIDSAVILRGQTEADRQVDVRAETSATVVSEPLPKGTFVEKGQLMCQLDPGTREASLAEARARLSEAKSRRAEAESRVPESRARVIEAQARLEEARVNQNAASRLSEDGFASTNRVKTTEALVAAAEAGVEAANSGLSAARSGIDSADAGIESAQAGVAAAEKEITRLQITAPFAGLLESDTTELGSLMQPGSLCANIIQLDPIKLVAYVPETEVDRIQTGAMAGARLAAGGEEVRGAVTFLSKSADPTTRTFRVEIKIPNPDLHIRDGQTAEILISADGAKAHLLPGSALTLSNDGTLGLRLLDEDARVMFAPVNFLRDTAEGVWLTGLPDNIDVVIVGQEYVTDGVQVAPTYQELSQ
jgi:multidrug efflux system membrane fusion protein